MYFVITILKVALIRFVHKVTKLLPLLRIKTPIFSMILILLKKSAFFFGTEKEGLSAQVLSQADTFLKIPMVGFTESLNISVAVAIVLQQLTDKLRRSEIAWQLSDEERLNTLIHWTKQSIRNVNDVLTRYEEIKDTL